MQPAYLTTNHVTAETLDALQRLIAAAHDDIFTAAALAVITEGEVVLHAGWGWTDEAHQHPLTPDTRFDLASVTKPFTATAFLTLASEGRVQVDDLLVSVLPVFGEGGARAIDGGYDPFTKEALPVAPELAGLTVDPETVTFRHLLTHTSGLAPWRQVYTVAGTTPPPPSQPDPLTWEERWQRGFEMIYRAPFVDLPGRSIRYSDLGFMLLGQSVRVLTGQPLPQALAARVLRPLSLNSVTYNPVQQGVPLSQIVPTEIDAEWRQRRLWGEVDDENAGGLGGVAGHAGLFGSVMDVARLGQAWLERDPRLGIDAALMDEAMREHARNVDTRRGLGWALQDPMPPYVCETCSLEAFGHTGFTGTSLWVEPRVRTVVACLTNRVYMGREKVGIADFRRGVHRLFFA